jgi:hypothetical protein
MNCLLLILALFFQCTYGTPVCTAIKYSGVVFETTGLFYPTNTVYTYSFNLNVKINNGNSTFPNVLTITNFTETPAKGYSRISPLKFVIDTPNGKSNETVSCPTINGDCVITTTNGFSQNMFDLNYLTVYDDTNLFTFNGGLFDGRSEQTINQSVCLIGRSDIIANTRFYEYNQTACCTQYTDINATDIPTSTDTGTQCASDSSMAWLDIVYVIDVSSGMTAINDLLSSIATVMEGLNVGQVGDHSTRVGIVTYGSNTVKVITQLSDTTTEDDFENILFGITIDPNDPGGNIAGGLNQAFNLIQSQRSYRKPAIVLAAATYNAQGVQNINGTVAQILGNGIDLVVINYATVEGILTKTLKSLAIDGYYYVSKQSDLIPAFSFGLTQINCYCPPTTRQLSIFNPHWSNYTKYADCFRAVSASSSPIVANKRDCKLPGSLVALTSQAKLDFITDNYFLVNQTLNGDKQLNIGLHKASDGTWKWWGYNGVEIPYDNWPLMTQTPSPNDNYGYMYNNRGFSWILKTGHSVPSPYICQTKACDVSNVCK